MPGFPWKHHEAGNLCAATAVLFLYPGVGSNIPGVPPARRGWGTDWQAEHDGLCLARGLLNDLDQVSFPVPHPGAIQKVCPS